MAAPAAPATLPPYTTLFPFEYKFDTEAALAWMQPIWYSGTGFYLTGAYVLLIFGGKALMASRPRFELKGPLVVWNLLLATFSIMGAYRLIPEQVYMLRQPDGYHQSVCLPLRENNPVFAFWTFLFILSKAPELGDTFFIVLRKQPLIFLHWYHHVTVLLYAWLSYAQYSSPSRWYMVMNFTIHGAMYSYYAARALGYRFPKSISALITSSQILQMVGGVVVNLHALQSKMDGRSCDVSFTNIYCGLTMYASYFVLFSHFFYKSYLSGAKGKGSRSKPEFVDKNGNRIKAH